VKVKRVCLILGFLIIFSLIIASCETETKTTTTTSKQTTQVTTATATKTTVDTTTPRYGGTISIALTMDPQTFDESQGMMHATAFTLLLTNQELMTGNWEIGPAGTGQYDWAIMDLGKIDGKTGCLAESWDIIEPDTMIFHIRQGVKFALNPASEASRLVNGREFTANDAVFSLKQLITQPRSAISLGDTRKAIITAEDERTVKIVLPPENYEDMLIMGDFASLWAPEVTQKYGNMTDWKNSVGTGPFILTDYIAASSANLERNNNYWETDPIGPGKGKQLPYLDGVKYLIIPDLSTRLSALRTAKIDLLNNVWWEDAVSLEQTNPELLKKKFYANVGLAINARVDKPNLPYKDIKVRRALMMATDFETIKNTFAGGEAQIVSWPILYLKEYKNAYLPLEEAPESVQELYKYNPEKAKTLLTEAGYPEGFTMHLICSNLASTIDYVSIVKDMWKEVGIELIIEPKEGAAMTGITFMRAYEEAIVGGPAPISNLYNGIFFTGAKFGGNQSMVDDPLAWEAKDKMLRIALTDPDAADAIHKEFMKYVLDQAWAIPAVTPPQYHFWYPWLKNYHGEMSIGYSNNYNYTKYAWIDKDLRKEMIGR